MAGHATGRTRSLSATLTRAIKPVLDSLEQRRLLSADVVEEPVVTEEGSEEAIYYTLEMVSDEGTVDGSGTDGEIPEEWIYMTMVPEDGEVVEGSEGEGDPDDVIYTTTVDDGEEVDPRVVLMPDGSEETDIDGDGEPDIILYTLEDGEVDLDGDGNPDDVIPVALAIPKAVLKKNGTLTVTGTDKDDVLSLTLNNAGEIEVKAGNELLGKFDADSVEKIKVSGGKGNDTITIHADIELASKLRGQAGNDTIAGGSGNDKITGGGGADDLTGGDGDDRIRGGKGKDDVDGQAGTDDVHGGRGDDKVKGGKGTDALRGGHGKDKLAAGSGDDFLNGGDGADEMIGGKGADGCQDEDNENKLDDEDGDDATFADKRLAAPFWWNGEASYICIEGAEDCDDMIVGDEMMPPWWQPGDSDGDDTGGEEAGDLAQRIDPSQFPDGVYPDDTLGDDELLI